MRKITSLLTLLLLMVSGVNVWGQLPESLELTTDKNNPVYYYIKSVRTNNNTAIFLHYNGDNTQPTRVANKETAGLEGYWYFMAGTNAANTVKIYNINGKALTHNLQFNTEGNDWFIKTNQYRESAFTISKQAEVGSGNNCIDASNNNAGLGWWNSTTGDNEGTAWSLEKAEALNIQSEIEKLSAKVNKSDLINKDVDNSYVGFMSKENKDALSQAISEASGKNTYADYKALENKINEILTPNFEEGAFYVIKNENPDNGVTKRYPSTQNMHSTKEGVFNTDFSNDRNIRRVKEGDALLPRLWKFEKQANGGYKIRNANTDCVWSSYVENGIDMPIDKQAGGIYGINYIPCNAGGSNVAAFNTKFTITISGHMINAYQGNSNTVIRDYNGNHIGDAGNYWSFKKVTEIPVTIGATGWASICLPFAVTLPSGVKAYIATAAQGDVITLEEITGTIPANTGMLLTATQGEHKLVISNTAATANVSNNLFKGANTKRLGFEVDSTFGLSANENTAVFKKNKLKGNNDKGYVPANKAYILTSDLGAAAQDASLLSIEFGGATTGIEGVQAEDNKEVIYFDLNGRRVMNPAHGVFVTNTGKKVFIR